MKSCPRCRRTHIGSLILASPGTLLLIRSDWEQCCTESDLEFQLRNQSPRIKPPPNLIRFFELANG